MRGSTLELDQLLDREEIKAVKARYCRCLDTKDWDGFERLFTEDAVLDVQEDSGQPPFAGRDALVAQVRAVVEPARTAHQVHSPEITFDGPHRASVVWAMHDRVIWNEGASPLPSVSALTGYGFYFEEYVRRGGDWRIASLRLTRTIVELDP